MPDATNQDTKDQDAKTDGHVATIEDLQAAPMDIGASALFNPPRGAFIPFSDGPRGCLGRRFAMAEIVAVVATFFRDYSVELDVRDAVDGFEARSNGELQEMIEGMGEGERKEVNEKAGKRAWRILDGELGGLVTLQQTREKVGVRVVRRGGELFW